MKAKELKEIAAIAENFDISGLKEEFDEVKRQVFSIEKKSLKTDVGHANLVYEFENLKNLISKLEKRIEELEKKKFIFFE